MIEVNRKQLSRAIDLASVVVERRCTISILTSLKCTANGALRLEGYDLDNWTCAELPYEGEAGEFSLPAPRMVRSAINQAGGEVVSIGPDDSTHKVRLRSGRLDSNLSSLPADDFPSTDRIGFEEFSATLGAAELKQIARVMAAISTEETRYYLNGVCVRKIGEWLYQFAATDGHRLMIIDVPLPDAQGTLPDNTIIPAAWLNIVMDRFTKAREGARLSYGLTAIPNSDGPELPLKPGGPRISLAADLDGIGYSLTGKLIDGKYPDYMSVIPADLRYFARFARADLARAVQALSSFSNERTRAVKLSFASGKICCELNSPDLGRSVFDIDAEHDVPVSVSHIAFNGKYLLGMLSGLTGSEVVLRLNGESDPAVVTDPADTAFVGVLMPMGV